MVSTLLKGRMGNQMFQIAAAIGYAKKHGLEFHIPAKTENNAVWPPHFTNLTSNLWDDRLVRVVLTEKGHNYQEIEFQQDWKNKNIILSGYWQSEKYFKAYKQDIFKAFGIYWQLLPDTCSVHIRRGDYLLHPTKHPVVTKEYLDQAIDHMLAKGVTMFIFFGDDMPWIKEYGNGRLGSIPVQYVFSEGQSELDDMALGSQCAHNIISNCTFSWWQAWLNQNPEKIVVSPHEANWFGSDNKHLDVSDLLPKEWVRIKY